MTLVLLLLLLLLFSRAGHHLLPRNVCVCTYIHTYIPSFLIMAVTHLIITPDT